MRSPKLRAGAHNPRKQEVAKAAAHRIDERAMCQSWIIAVACRS